MAKRLTKKEKGFVKDFLETGNATQAALKNYDTKDYSTAGVIGHENLNKPKIQLAVSEAFPDTELYQLHREGLYDEDLGIRHKYLETAYKLKGSYAAEKHVNLNVSAEVDDRLDGLIEQIEHGLDNPEGTT